MWKVNISIKQCKLNLEVAVHATGASHSCDQSWSCSTQLFIGIELHTIRNGISVCLCQVGASILSRVLQRLPRAKSIPGDSDILVGLDAPDDAAVIRPPPAGHVMVQTVDFFRSFVDDPYVFGAIAANHALGVRDVFFHVQLF